MVMKTLVGIVPRGVLFEDTNPRKDVYYAGNNYGKRIYECGGIPLTLLPDDGYIPEEVLDNFDSFLICGGNKMWPYHFEVIHHAITKGKPLLGICLGMQCICCYFELLDYIEETGCHHKGLFEAFEEMRQDPEHRLEKFPGHQYEHIRGREEETKHDVKLLSGSHIHRFIGKDVIKAGSFHNYRVKNISPRLTVSGRAKDGTIEVVEYGENVLGCQFHPEIDDKLMPIFDILFKNQK